jgi:hypothetical protein
MGKTIVGAYWKKRDLDQEMKQWDEKKKLDERRLDQDAKKISLDDAMDEWKRGNENQKLQLDKDKFNDPLARANTTAEIDERKARAGYYNFRDKEKPDEITTLAEKDQSFGNELRARMDAFKEASWNAKTQPSEANTAALNNAQMSLQRWQSIGQKIFSMTDKVMKPPVKKIVKKTGGGKDIYGNESPSTTETWDEPIVDTPQTPTNNSASFLTPGEKLLLNPDQAGTQSSQESGAPNIGGLRYPDQGGADAGESDMSEGLPSGASRSGGAATRPTRTINGTVYEQVGPDQWRPAR